MMNETLEEKLLQLSDGMPVETQSVVHDAIDVLSALADGMRKELILSAIAGSASHAGNELTTANRAIAIADAVIQQLVESSHAK